DLPAGDDQSADDVPQSLSGDFDVVAPLKRIEHPSGAELFEIAPRRLFALAVAAQASPQFALNDRSLRARTADECSRVFEAHLAGQPFVLPANSARRE